MGSNNSRTIDKHKTVRGRWLWLLCSERAQLKFQWGLISAQAGHSSGLRSRIYMRMNYLIFWTILKWLHTEHWHPWTFCWCFTDMGAVTGPSHGNDSFCVRSSHHQGLSQHHHGCTFQEICSWYFSSKCFVSKQHSWIRSCVILIPAQCTLGN